MPEYFGTDGIRFIPFNYPLTQDFIRKIGYAISKRLKDKDKPAFIARDTRKTGVKIAKLLTEGIASYGVKVFDLGVITTPSLSYILSSTTASFGVMVSASHNPAEFNGIKVLGSDGQKVAIEIEEEIESIVNSINKISFKKIKPLKRSMENLYVNYVVSKFKNEFANNVVIDCANGSSYEIAPRIFKKLGFNFHLIGANPDGYNINKSCGAVDVDSMRKEVIKNKLFCGISYDGDGDRCILADSYGEVIDGDDIIALLAIYYKKTGELKNNGVVLTHMSNFGLTEFLKDNKIKVFSVDVGDRNVSNAMIKHNLVLGGEPSGHVIIRKYLSTGDGIITSLEFLRVLKEMKLKPEDVKKIWKRFPSYLKSYRIENRVNINKLDGFVEKVKAIEKEINGRIFIRYSGTEPLLRVLIEADKTKEELAGISDSIFSYYTDALKSLR